jgi:hypothetical protein
MVDVMRPEDDVVAACGVLEVEPVLSQGKQSRPTVWLK